jgi:hypothetical protein
MSYVCNPMCDQCRELNKTLCFRDGQLASARAYGKTQAGLREAKEREVERLMQQLVDARILWGADVAAFEEREAGLREAIERHIDYVGSFINGVQTNDLREALARFDAEQEKERTECEAKDAAWQEKLLNTMDKLVAAERQIHGLTAKLAAAEKREAGLREAAKTLVEAAGYVAGVAAHLLPETCGKLQVAVAAYRKTELGAQTDAERESWDAFTCEPTDSEKGAEG